MAIRSLIINPGSTSTKIAVFEDEEMLFDKTLRHSVDEISKYDTIFDQKQFRKDIIMECLKEQDFDIKTLDMVVGRGGLVKPIPGGTYKVSDALIEDLKVGPQGQHASNLGGVLAREIADEIGKPSFIVDPVAVDELQPVARVSGIPDIQRNSIFHPLNQKAMARRYAKENGKRYEDINVIVAHMGGGVSVGAHKKGRVIDVSNALEGDGAFSPERAGGLPVGPLVRLCYSGKYTEKEMYKRLVGGGGFTAYLGSNDMVEITKKAENDENARLVLDAFIYQVAKDIGSRAAVLEGKVDAIILTGGIAYGSRVTDAIAKYVDWIAPVVVYPGEDELLALAQGGLRVLNGEEEAKDY
ncbi:MAG: butyrate kinase [Lachnospiraceae bacterium]|nr:butyrate kinase [Lachnospiraceae bacterium]